MGQRVLFLCCLYVLMKMDSRQGIKSHVVDKQGCKHPRFMDRVACKYWTSSVHIGIINMTEKRFIKCRFASLQMKSRQFCAATSMLPV